MSYKYYKHTNIQIQNIQTYYKHYKYTSRCLRIHYITKHVLDGPRAVPGGRQGVQAAAGAEEAKKAHTCACVCIYIYIYYVLYTYIYIYIYIYAHKAVSLSLLPLALLLLLLCYQVAAGTEESRNTQMDAFAALTN